MSGLPVGRTSLLLRPAPSNYLGPCPCTVAAPFQDPSQELHVSEIRRQGGVGTLHCRFPSAPAGLLTQTFRSPFWEELEMRVPQRLARGCGDKLPPPAEFRTPAAAVPTLS